MRLGSSSRFRSPVDEMHESSPMPLETMTMRPWRQRRRSKASLVATAPRKLTLSVCRAISALKPSNVIVDGFRILKNLFQMPYYLSSVSRRH